MKNILQIAISLLFLFAIQVSTSPTGASFTKIDPEKELCEDTSDENRNEDKILKICKVRNRTDGNELQTYSQPYEVTAEEFIFEQISLKCTEKSEANCGVRFNAIKLIKITESDIVASSIDFIGEEAELIMCAKSGLSTKGMGFIRGKGTQGGFGGSYAGQGGVGNRLEKEMTYGSFSQEPEFYKFHNNQMGSGGSIGNNKGGGVVVIKVKTASINGRIVADGSPDSKTDIIKNYEGASGGYIYISCKSQSYLGHKAIISANGGIGNSDETINGLSGSGGRIVLSNITCSITDQIKVSGGCANTLAPSIKNGAGGTIYLADKKELHITHTTSCISLLRTVVDPNEITEQDVQQIYVDHQGVMAFSSSAISSGKITAKINNLNLVNGNLTCPIRSDNSDKSLQSMELEVTHKLQMINATILRPASDFRLKVNEFEMKHSGKIIYGNDALWLDVSQKFNISGLIFPYDLSYGEATSTSNPKVFVLAGIKAQQPPPSTEEEDPDFIFGKASGIMGKSIQIFSDKNITIKGNLNNYYITHDKQLKLVQSCITVNPDQTEFTDVFRCVNQGLKGSKLSQTMLIDQFNTQFESEKPVEQYSELFTKMTKDYSIYIQSLGTVHLSGNLTGNRVGLCSSNLTITGIINTTEGGCPHDKGVLQPSDNKPSTTNVCCNRAGGSYGGKGISGTPNKNIVECSATQEKCDEEVVPKFNLSDVNRVAFQGSGGRGTNGGSGGGAIWLHSLDTLYLNCTIEANGGHSLNDKDSTYGDGGGSGGAISITTTKVQATPDTIISAAGGLGYYGGGGGSGGLIFGVVNKQGNKSVPLDNIIRWSGIFNLSFGLSLNREKQSPHGNFINIGKAKHDHCERGREGVFCAPCAVGFYNQVGGETQCLPCKRNAKNSLFRFLPGEQISEDCEYYCFPTFPDIEKNKDCLPPFSWFISVIGGWYSILGILSLIIVSILLLWLYIRMKSIKRERNKTKYSFNNLQLNDKRKILEDEEFTTADLPFQICRAYFRGTNMIGNQWTIPLEPPQKLKNLVYMSAYEEFTTQLNNCSTWKKKERYCYYFIGLIFPPLLPLFMYRNRRKKFKKLRNVAAGLQKGIWLNNTEKRRANYVAKTIKISASPDYTMACIDFLDIERDREYYNGPTLPLTFHLSGDGFFNSPFNLSYKDCLVRSLSLLDRTENFIEIYIENLNSLLKSLSFFEYLSFSEAKFWKLIKFLHTNNLGILKKRSIKAELAILEYKNKGNKTVKQGSDKKNYKSNSQTYIFHFDFISKYPQTVGHIVEYCRYELYTRNTDIKLAIVFSRSDQSTIIPMTGHIDIQAYASRGTTESLLTSNERFNNSTKISDVTIPKFYNSGEESNRESDGGESSEEYDQMFTGLKSKWTEPFLIKGDDKKTKQRNDSYSVTESNYSQASYSPNKVEVEDYENNEQLAKMLHDDNPLNDFRNRRHSRGCCFQFKISIVAFLKLGFLRSSLPPKYPILNLSMMIIVLFLDIAAAMMIFLLYWQKEEFQAPLAPFAFIYPFTVILSPLMALTSILVCKSSFYRIFMNLNALTCISNIFLTLLVELILAFFMGSIDGGQMRSSQTVEPILLLIGKIVLKVMMAYFACKQLAFNENHEYWKNKDLLDNIHTNVSKENTRDYVSEMFRRESEDEED